LRATSGPKQEPRSPNVEFIGCQRETVFEVPWAADCCPCVEKLRTALPFAGGGPHQRGRDTEVGGRLQRPHGRRGGVELSLHGGGFRVVLGRAPPCRLTALREHLRHTPGSGRRSGLSGSLFMEPAGALPVPDAAVCAPPFRAVGKLIYGTGRGSASSDFGNRPIFSGQSHIHCRPKEF
jgi:hypothetical protein